MDFHSLIVCKKMQTTNGWDFQKYFFRAVMLLSYT